MSAKRKALTLLKGSTVKPGHHAKILTAMLGLGLAAAACSSTSTSSSASSASSTTPATTPAFLGELHGLTQVASTVPANGDVNPYGVAVVPASGGRLTAGDILVSNFNDKANVQGTGTTIVQVSPAGKTSVFASIAALPAGQTCPGGIGLTTALGILPGGWVVVGSLPTDPDQRDHRYALEPVSASSPRSEACSSPTTGPTRWTRRACEARVSPG
jgi:hypothetical protein